MKHQRLFLIDGSALFYRSYYAYGQKNPLINSKGENTSASFGFIRFLMDLIDTEKPDYLAVVFDSKGEKTFRHEKYPAYKANREAMPEEMALQYPRIAALVEAMEIPLLAKPGYEADDIIGTLARKAEREQIETYMVTIDKDMLQLISPLIKMYKMPRSGKNSVEILDEQAVKEQYKLNPDQIIDFLALMGDSSDNIPGVPKVGKKTAQQLLKQFGSMEAVYENLESISRKALRATLDENREIAKLSKELVIIDTNVPLEHDLAALKYQPLNNSEPLENLFDALEFRSLKQRLSGQAAESTAAQLREYDPERQHYILIDTPEKLQAFASELQQQPAFVFDTETTGLNIFQERIVGIAFSWKADEGYYVPFENAALPFDGSTHTLSTEAAVAILKPIFEDPNLKKIAQNIKFDALMLWQHGIELRGIDFDTMIASYLLTTGAREHNLDKLAERYLKYRMISIETLIGSKGKKQKSMADVPLAEVTPYACEDADITWQLKEALEEKLRETDTEKLFREVEMPLVEVLLEMEKSGVSLDKAFLKQMSGTLQQEIEQLRQEIYQMAGSQFNVNSNQQLGNILFETLEIHKEMGSKRPRRTATGQYSTSEAELLKYDHHPLVSKILEHRKLVKLTSTYVDALPQLVSSRTGRLHTSFNQTVAATGRLSSSDPNLQNIPIRGEKGREIRKGFIPANPENYLLSADYSQIELRVMAHIARDPGFKAAFESDEDIHSSTAAAIFDVPLAAVTPEQRRKAKDINFGMIYGISRYGLASRLKISAAEAEGFIYNYFVRFPKVNDYITETIQFVRTHKYVMTLLNRRRYIPEIDVRNANQRQVAERIAINAPIQGSAADLIKIAMIRIQRRLREEQLQTQMILQVHDELVFEVPAAELETVKPLIKMEMETAMTLDVPLKVEIGVGKNWLEAH